jgi:osmotically inducible lipoprotein OsmB
MKRSIGMLLACGVLLGGCASWSDARKGTAIGAGAGAVIGNAVGGGVLGTVGGAAVGGVVGHEIGKNQDEKKEQK